MSSRDHNSAETTESVDLTSGRKSSAPTRSPLLRVLRLSRKELRESLRDRRTLATLILMPLIVYPLLGSVVQRFAISRVDPNSPPAVVVFDNSIPLVVVQAILGEELNEARTAIDEMSSKTPESSDDAGNKERSTPSLQAIAGTPTGEAIGALINRDESQGPPIKFLPYESPVKAEFMEEFLQTEEADVGVRQTLPGRDKKTGRILPGRFDILSRSGDAFSRRAALELESRLLNFRDRELRDILDQTRFGSGIMPTVSQQSVKNNGPRTSPLAAFVPLMLVLMTMTGAVYPAIDLTAGERERGTLEILMAAPVSRTHLLTGKFIAVLTVAVLTAVINLVAMLLTLYATGFDRVLLADGASVTMFLQILALLVVFASFFSAVLLCITSFARSFREAQAWLIPLMLVSLAPGILSLIPGVHLTIGLALVPLVNIVLLGRELFQGTASVPLYAVTLLSTLAYTLLALRVAANAFGHDAVLFGQSATVPAFSKRRNTPQTRIPFAIGIGWLVLLVPLFLVLSGLRSKVVAIENLSGQLILSACLTILLFAAIPVAITKWIGVSAADGFALKRFHGATLLGAILLGCTMWTIAYEVLIFSQAPLKWMEMLNNTKLRELAQRLTTETPLIIRITALAIVPAVCEELFFRGFLINTLMKHKDRWLRPMLVSTFVFAAFHVIVDQSLTLERFPATFLLGLALCGIRLSSGSIIPGIVMHAVSNGLLLSLKDLDPWLQFIGLNLNVENEASLPVWFLVSSILVSGTGAGFVWMGRKRAHD